MKSSWQTVISLADSTVWPPAAPLQSGLVHFTLSRT
jgi:hypothetical protein